MRVVVVVVVKLYREPSAGGTVLLAGLNRGGMNEDWLALFRRSLVFAQTQTKPIELPQPKRLPVPSFH